MQCGSEPLYPRNSTLVPEKENSIPMVVTTSPTAPTQYPLLLGPDPTVSMCPFCRSTIQTAIQHTVTTRTHIAALLCCSLCCCCMPYLADSAKNTDHFCPKCDKFLGTYEK